MKGLIGIMILLGIYNHAIAERMQRLQDSWYIGGSIGAGSLDPTVPAGSSVIDDKSLSMKGYAGINIFENLGLEAFWTNLGKSSIAGSVGNGSIKYSAIGVNGVYHLPVNAGLIHPFGKLGIAKVNTSSSNILLSQKNNFAVFGGFGADYDLSKGLKIRAEYNYFTKDIGEINIGLNWTPNERVNHPEGTGSYGIPAALPIITPTRPVNTVKVNTQNTSLSGASLFNSGSARLSPAGLQRLNQLIRKVRNPNFKLYHITITGHTDNRGNARKNLSLSKRRAESVARYMASRGVPRASMSVIGYGESKPVASNASVSGRARNRRVEITIKGVQRVMRQVR